MPSLVKFLLQDTTIKDIKKFYSDKYKTSVASNAIRSRFIKYFGLGSAFRIKLMLLEPSIDECFKRGYSPIETLNYLKEAGFQYYDGLSQKMAVKKLKEHAVGIFGDLRPLKSRKFDRWEAIKASRFVAPYVQYLRASGFDYILPPRDAAMIRDPDTGQFIGRVYLDPRSWSILEHLFILRVPRHYISQYVGLTPSEYDLYLSNRWSHTLKIAGLEFNRENLRNFLITSSTSAFDNYDRYLNLPSSMRNIDYQSRIGDFPLKLNKYYSRDFVDILLKKGIGVREDLLVAVTKSRGDNRIIWLDRNDFLHVLDRHAGQFETYFGLSGPYEIGNFIFNAITKRDVYRSYPGMGKAKVYVYRFGNNFLQVVVGTDGNIVTAYPSVFSN